MHYTFCSFMLTNGNPAVCQKHCTTGVMNLQQYWMAFNFGLQKTET